MKKVAAAAVAGVVALAMAVPAVAQTPDRVTSGQLNVTPAKGGSVKKPKNGKMTFSFDVDPNSRTTASAVNYLVPKNVKLNGKGFATCSAAKINAKGPGACPKGSLVGTGAAEVAVGGVRGGAIVGPAAVDPYKVNVYVQGPKRLAIYLIPGPVEVAAFDAPITKAGGKYGQKIKTIIPKEAQSTAGLDVYLTKLSVTIGGRKATIKKRGKRKTVYFTSVTGCPKGGKHLGAVSIDYVANQTSTESGTTTELKTNSACRK